MTVERLLKPETPPAGHRVQEPRPINSTPRTIAGGKPLKKDLGHRNWNQTIHHLFERRNDIRSSVYREIAAGGSVELDPARLGSYTLRLESNASIALKKPPRVPPEQGSERTRWWSIRVRAYYASEATITWPSNVFGARDIALTPGAEGEYSLEEISSLPGQPGAAGTSDVFDLMYDERTGEWFVAWHVRGAVTSDPSAKEPDAVDPDPAPGEPTPPGTDPGEPTDPDGPTDGDYTDPDTGEPVVPEQPTGKSGNLVALHDGAVSFSADCGQWWRLIGGAPDGSAEIASLANVGTVIRTAAGDAFFSRNLQNWGEIDLRFSQSVDLPLVNGGFETGDLTGWTHVSGTVPLVLDTAQPPQQQGQYYLAGNPEDFTFEVSQEIELPAGQFDEVVVRAKVYTEMLAAAEIEVRSGWDGESYTLPDVRLRPEAPFNKNILSDSLALLTVAGSGVQYLADLMAIDGFTSARDDREHLFFRFSDRTGTGAWYGGVSNSYTVDNTPELIAFPSGAAINDLEITLTNSARPGLEVVMSVPRGWKVPIGYLNSANSFRELSTKHKESITHLTIPPENYTPAGNVESVSIPGTDQWHEVELRAQAGDPSSIASVVLRGTDSDVVFDDVRVSVESSGATAATALCRDLATRRHLVATETAILTVGGTSSEKIADAPIPAEHIAAHGDKIVIAAPAGQIAISTDGGVSWATHATSKPFRQVFAHPMTCGMLDDGTVVSILSSGVHEYSSHPAGSWMTWSARAQKWLLTYPYGSVFSSDDLATWTNLPDMPANAEAGFRRLIAADIGRRIGWADGGRDMFIQDAGQGWVLAPSLAAPILDMEEIK